MGYIGNHVTVNGVIYRPRSADPSNPKEGQLFYSDGTARAKGLWVYKDSNWSQVGAGVSDKSVYGQFDAEDQSVTGFTNISVSGSGALNQDNSYIVDAFPASLPAVSLNSRNKLKENSVEFHYTLTSGTAKAVVKDQTATVISEVDLEATNDAQKVILSHFVSGSMSDLTLEFQDVSSATGLKVDDIIFSDDPFKYKNLINYKHYQIQQDGVAMSNVSGDLRYNLGSAAIIDDGAVTAIDDASNNRTNFKVSGSGSLLVTTSYQTTNTNDTTQVKRLDSSGTLIQTYVLGKTAASADTNTNAITFNVNAEDLIVVNATVGVRSTAHQCVVNFKLSQQAEHVITPVKNQVNIFSAKISNNGTASLISENSSFIQSVSRTSTGLIDVVFTSGLFSENPVVIPSADHLDGTSNVNVEINNVTATGCQIRTRNNSDSSAVDTDVFLSVHRQGTDVKNAAFESAIPVQRTVYLKDVKPSGTNGGTFPSGSWQTRDLNTVEGNSAIVSLSANQFTLPAGVYEVTWSAPAKETDGHQTRLTNITDSTHIYGESSFSTSSTVNAISDSNGHGRVEIESSKVFELQHRCANSTSNDGFGRAVSFGNDEVYAQIKITKIK